MKKKMENKEFFYDANDKEGLSFLIDFLTLGLSFILFYTRFHIRKYYLNRRLLYNLLKDNKIHMEYKGKVNSLNGIDEYIFSWGDKHYMIWHYYQTNEFTLSLVEWNEKIGDWITKNIDLIGLFKGDLTERIICKKIMKYFKRNNNIQIF